MQNISNNTQIKGTSNIACQLVLPSAYPNKSVINRPIILVIWAEIAARNGISSAGNTVLSNKFLLDDKDVVEELMASLNAISGIKPEKTNKTYPISDKPVGLILKI